MKSKFKATHKITTPQLNKQKSQKNSPLCAVYSPLCTPYEVGNISSNINIVIWNNIEGHQTQFRFFEQNLFFWQKKNLSNQWRINLIRMISQRPSPLHRCAGGPLTPQYFADQLTLFEPGRADYPHLLLLAPPMFSPSDITACKKRRPQIILP